MQKINLRIEGMSCDGCKRTVAIAIEDLNGVKNAQVDLQKKEAEVTFDDMVVSKEKIIEAVDNTGIYKAQEIL